MASLLRYLVSLALHIAWARMGKGPIPAVKLPRRGPVNLPAIGPWQMMIGLWLLNRIWDRYGHGVKSNLANHSNPAARMAGSLLPDVPANASTATHSAAPGGTSASAPATANSGSVSSVGSVSNPHSTAATPATPGSSVAPTPASAPAPNFATRLLSRGQKSSASSPATASNPKNSNLPAGSVLGALRRSSRSNS